MNAVEIEQAITDLAEQPFDREEFPYVLLEAFGNKATTLKRLRAGVSEKSAKTPSTSGRPAFPEMKGFSPRNLKYMRVFTEAWPEPELVQEVLAQLPWYHQLTLLEKLPGPQTRKWYAAKISWVRG